MDSEARRLFADNLTVTRGSRQVLKGISFQVSAGEFMDYWGVMAQASPRHYSLF